MVYEEEDTIMQVNHKCPPEAFARLTRITAFVWTAIILCCISACGSEETNRAPAVSENDSFPFMQSWGVSTFISDSGVIRYKIIAEEWNIYNNTKPPRWTFLKGILLEKFDSTFHIDWFVQSDTAYCHNQKLWELRGRVVIRNQEGTVFTSEELFWDMDRHEMYSTQFMTIRKPDEFLQGYNFRSNEQMTRYSVTNANAETPFKDDSPTTANDTVSRTAPSKPIQP